MNLYDIGVASLNVDLPRMSGNEPRLARQLPSIIALRPQLRDRKKTDDLCILCNTPFNQLLYDSWFSYAIF